MSTGQAPGNASSLCKLQDCGEEIQQNKTENINEILERIHQTCAVQKQEASQLKTQLASQNVINLEGHSKGHLIKPQLGHQQRHRLINEQQNQRTYSHGNKENENREIRHNNYIPRQQTGQQAQKNGNNQNRWKRVEENVGSSSQYHQHPNRFSDSQIPVQQNRYLNQQYPQQNSQQMNLQSGQTRPNKNHHKKPSLPAKQRCRTADVQHVQQIINTREGQRIVQHPHIFDPKIHTPIIMPCSVSAAPVLPVRSAVTLPLSVDTSLDYEIVVPYQSPSDQSKLYHNLPIEHKGSFSGYSDSKQVGIESLLLITVAALHRTEHFRPYVNSFGNQGGLPNRSQKSDSTFAFSPESNSMAHPDNSHLLNAEQYEKFKSTRRTNNESNTLLEHIRQDWLQNLTSYKLINMIPPTISSYKCSVLASHSYIRLSKSCSNLVASNSVSQHLWVNMADPNPNVDLQKSPNCQQQALVKHRSYSAPDLRTYRMRCSDLESSYSVIRKMCANIAKPDKCLESQRSPVSEQKTVPEDSHPPTKEYLTNTESVIEAEVRITKQE
ncbi:uncharacterized protein [Macrobrachium rosenbergii]|uniref:uncharacterized protein n=1 Tax=Macrobrachium rosenbergii TaxID=79674 RepID=UPI0034D6FCFD